MSSSRILSSRPSASCITAKPIARTIKGRGRNVSPFFAAQKQESRAGFSPEPPGALLYGSLSRKPHSPLPGRSGGAGVSAPPHRKWGRRADFSARARRRHLLYGSLSRKPHGSLPGHWRFCATQPEVGKPSGLFHQRMPGALIYGSLSRKPHSPLPGHCGGAGASASHRRKWKPCHKRKKRRKFPPLF